LTRRKFQFIIISNSYRSWCVVFTQLHVLTTIIQKPPSTMKLYTYFIAISLPCYITCDTFKCRHDTYFLHVYSSVCTTVCWKTKHLTTKPSTLT